jgi:hypothetical protein
MLTVRGPRFPVPRDESVRGQPSHQDWSFCPNDVPSSEVLAIDGSATSREWLLAVIAGEAGFTRT